MRQTDGRTDILVANAAINYVVRPKSISISVQILQFFFYTNIMHTDQAT